MLPAVAAVPEIYPPLLRGRAPLPIRVFSSNSCMSPLSSTSVPTVKVSSRTSQGIRQDWQNGWFEVMKTDLAVQLYQYQLSQNRRLPSATVLCAAAFFASRCAAEQTQTVTRDSSTITLAPTQGKQKALLLDDGGSGFPPRGDGGGGGGGGGGGHNSSGGFYFFAVLLFLSFLKDLEKDEHTDERRS